MTTLVSLFIRHQWVIALVAQEAMFKVHFIEHFQLCPLGFASWAFVFFTLFFWDGVALDCFVDGVNAPLNGIDGGSVINKVV